MPQVRKTSPHKKERIQAVRTADEVYNFGRSVYRCAQKVREVVYQDIQFEAKAHCLQWRIPTNLSRLRNRSPGVNSAAMDEIVLAYCDVCAESNSRTEPLAALSNWVDQLPAATTSLPTTNPVCSSSLQAWLPPSTLNYEESFQILV